MVVFEMMKSSTNLNAVNLVRDNARKYSSPHNIHIYKILRSNSNSPLVEAIYPMFTNNTYV